LKSADEQRRDVSEREHTIKWFQDKVGEVEKETEEGEPLSVNMEEQR
jgi:hypothetical protein